MFELSEDEAFAAIMEVRCWGMSVLWALDVRFCCVRHKLSGKAAGNAWTCPHATALACKLLMGKMLGIVHVFHADCTSRDKSAIRICGTHSMAWWVCQGILLSHIDSAVLTELSTTEKTLSKLKGSGRDEGSGSMFGFRVRV